MDPVKIIDDKTSISAISQRAAGFSLPPVVPFKTKVTVKEGSGSYSTSSNLEFEIQCHISLGIPGNDLYKIPFDPILSCKGANRIKERYVNKGKIRGSVKERWTQDDYELTISGTIVADSYKEMCDICKKLRELCEQGTQGLDISNDVLNNTYNIWKIAVYDWDIPFTPGMENQEFSITAKSDDIYDLLVEIKEQ